MRLPDDIIHKLVKERIGGPACMNKGFILDGYPRNSVDAKAIFLDPIPGYEAPEESQEEAKGETQEPKDSFPGFVIS